METEPSEVVEELFRETSDKNDDTEELKAEVHSGVQASLDAESFLSVNRSKVSDSSGDQVDEEDLMTMYTDDVIEINDELMKIAMQIRSPNSRQPRHKNYSSGKIDHDERDVYKSVLMSFRKKGIEQTMISARLRRLSIDQAATTPVLRGSDEFLVDRISKANDFRRQQFDYWRRYRSHSVRATTNAAVAADADDPHDKVQPRVALTPTADVAFGRSDQKAPKTVSMPSPDTLYENRDQWIQHEQWNHMCFWRCPKDEIEFENLSAYEDHIITQHPAATAAGNKLLSDGVLETQRFLTEQPSRSCPFCDVDLEGVEEMYDHIGGHLETVAMLAIPTLDDRDLQSNPDAASSEAAGRDVDGSRKNDFEEALPVLFPENDHPDHHPPAEQQMSGSHFERLLAGLPDKKLLIHRPGLSL
ncbi:MAG: hypothetical protein LQ339_007129 [Xanthoria mediterranea]|nr:MAG: hypothetical protein LQ339_007129 [Xanthoria mediterranea]